MDYRILYIGALSQNELRPSAATVQAHATCTLIRSADRAILVDPSLPGPLLAQKLMERAGLRLEDITDVFLTHFRPAHRHGLPALEHAQWWIHELERESIGAHLVARIKAESEDAELQALLGRDVTLLHRCKPAPDRLAPDVDLFPLPGYTPGTCGLLLSFHDHTVIIAGDAVGSEEHLEHGRILRGAVDAAQAQESFQEVLEIADLIVPGHGNICVNPLRRRGLLGA